MKKNLKLSIIWLVIIAVIYGILIGLINAGVINEFVAQIITQIGINLIVAVGLNLVIGFTGQFSFGSAGFMAIGAYSSAIISARMAPTWGTIFLSMLIGAIVAGIVAIIVGYPTLRLKGDYLAIATLGVSEIIRILIMNGGDLTNGAAGLSGIILFTDWGMTFIFAVVVIVLILNFINSPSGRATLSVREDEIASESMGVNVTRVKVIAFTIGAMVTAVAGSLYAGFIGTVTPKDFTWMKSVDALIIVVLGGLGSITGTIIAAVILGLLNMFLQDFGAIRMIIYSLILILVMIFRPGGLLGTWEFKLSSFFNKKENKESN
ncbi:MULTISPECIES: branched-chain amino acid ABC transporter permease [Pseudolactococcus]|jgi:branched-chain amino acid transport system permease protein|uniref:Branched-chain amino acid transport system permease protein LivM n=1 Tax=Pseudolactococcus piscium MKFS47 TaxID=297352 RepID=A0A0D6DTW0_9LACT|nr:MULTISPECIES: branched-chain amino acid ABC transporter permease [Lactococcus]MBR6894609.1 branched-chain amino acid ABC transporter permease [Lactococcus sp.]SCA90961.1 putative High-affinity branched-chain amino acid transport system permease protein LivM [Lactococcus piscium]MCJ1970673.1 branched-chain amino acid ABC transporter permease [Lactococcus carnosus]MCJ1975088.1 branched-chain amino acid ABC transporter permease [Lactococcus carnosus]MCJ1985444.1 branched-chain amino acid ABC t